MLLFSLSSSNTFKGIALTFLMQDTASGFRRTSSSARLPRRTASTAHGFRRTASGARLPARGFRRRRRSLPPPASHGFRRMAGTSPPARGFRRVAQAARLLRGPGCCLPALGLPVKACQARGGRGGAGGGGGAPPRPVPAEQLSCTGRQLGCMPPLVGPTSTQTQANLASLEAPIECRSSGTLPAKVVRGRP